MSFKKKKWLIKKVIFARFKNLFIKNNNNKNLIPKKKYTTNLRIIANVANQKVIFSSNIGFSGSLLVFLKL